MGILRVGSREKAVSKNLLFSFFDATNGNDAKIVYYFYKKMFYSIL